MNLARSLKVALAKRDIKNKDFAVMMDVTPQQISNWVSGQYQMNSSNMVRACDALNMKVSEFVALGEE
tara:strand:+ start:1078 stop:1281 length:204 start_codon:yes stop_codon:yes gene_type:complete